MAGSPRTVDGLGLEELKSLIVRALAEDAWLKAENAKPREEIARLKGLKSRPKIKPSGMETATDPAAQGAKGPRWIGRRGPNPHFSQYRSVCPPPIRWGVVGSISVSRAAPLVTALAAWAGSALFLCC